MKGRRWIGFASAVVIALACGACAPADSHVAAHVPPADRFDDVLRRDVTAYFALAEARPVRVEPELLRREPMVAGEALPKYYAWVHVHDDSSGVLLAQGAVRLAAVDGQGFEVTDFLSREQLRLDPNAADRVFPALLRAGVLERAHR